MFGIKVDRGNPDYTEFTGPVRMASVRVNCDGGFTVELFYSEIDYLQGEATELVDCDTRDEAESVACSYCLAYASAE